VTTVRILGPIEVCDGERRVELGGPRQVSLLALLVLTANRGVTSDALIDALWREGDVSGRKRLQMAVRRLRQALEPVSGDGRLVLETVAGGYLLRLERTELDSEVFAVGVAAGQAALRAGEFEQARDCLAQALSLWRGPPLAEVVFEDFAGPEIRRLEELRASALESRIDADLQLGHDAELVSELEALVSEEPVRERLAGQLMTALYRGGRQADALDVYQRIRTHLAEQLGLEPGPTLRALQTQILAHDPALEFSPRVAPAPAGNLPVPATPFLGRARELIEVTTLLQDADTRLLTLTGVGGTGKTRLALRVADVAASCFPEGRWFIDFADVIDSDLIATTICQAVDGVGHADLAPSARLERWFGDRRVLLVLDNLEQLADDTTILGELLTRCPGVKLLVTSREPLQLAGEYQYAVPVLTLADAVELFVARARALAPSRVIDLSMTTSICERVDCLPLAIELAAARTKVLSLADLRARLDRSLPLLRGGPRNAPRRQQTLTATFDWSFDLLSEEERRLFARLGIFAGGCTLPAAEAVSGANVDTMHGLVDRSLVKTDGERYWMLRTMRDYALERLKQRGEADELRQAHVRWLIDLLEAEGLPQPGRPRGGSMIRVAAERDNFRAALAWTSETAMFEAFACLAAGLGDVWIRLGQIQEAKRAIELALQHEADYVPRLAAQVVSAARSIAWHEGLDVEAATLAKRALALWHEVGDFAGIGKEMISIGRAACITGDLIPARAQYERATGFAREHRLTELLQVALNGLGDIAIHEGKLEEGRALCEESLATAAPGSVTGVVALINLAHVECLEGDPAKAERLGADALDIALRRGDVLTAAWAAIELAWPLAEQGMLEPSARLLGAGIEFLEHTGAKRDWMSRASERTTRTILFEHLDAESVEALVNEGRGTSVETAALYNHQPSPPEPSSAASA
jgi:predicted ATPase/DNA-binding SARP family transcriptional activator